MTQNSAPWIFVLKEEMLPGRFSLQPVEPSVGKLQKIDPENSILKSVYLAYVWASAEYEVYVTHVGHDIEVLARTLARCLERQLKVQKVFVIPNDEFWRRVYRGEFKALGELSIEDRLKMGQVFHRVMSSVIEDYYCGLPPERQEEVFLRMQPFDLSALPKGGVCVGYDEETGLRIRPLYNPEVYKIRGKAHKRAKHRWFSLVRRAEHHMGWVS